MRVVWLCNPSFVEEDTGKSGTWLGPIARGLRQQGGIEMTVLSFGSVAQLTEHDCGGIRQWVVPWAYGLRDLPAPVLVREIQQRVRDFAPDLIHVWGSECYFGLLTARRLLEAPALLQLQGLKWSLTPVFEGGLSLREQWRSTGLREILRGLTIPQQKRQCRQWTSREREIVRGHAHVVTQCHWVAAQVRAVAPEARLYHGDLPLREEFLTTLPWQRGSGQPAVFMAAAYPGPFKGVHVAVQALAQLRRRCPGVSLRVGGLHPGQGLRREGYLTWVNRLAAELGVADGVVWLGSLSAQQMAEEMRGASAVLMPSFVESYSMALVEAMQVGAPVVSAFTGGTAFLGRDEETCLFFLPGDAAMCAYQMERVLTDQALALRLSRQGKSAVAARHDLGRIVGHLRQVYGEVAHAPTV
jgi:glycosyltransferase involved in cell wall biosynthesis